MTITELRFPRDRKGQMATESPIGPGSVNDVWLFPKLGIMAQAVPWCVMEDGFVYDPFDVRGSTPEPGEPVDIGRRTRSLIAAMRDFGVEGVTHPDMAASREGEWSADYAIVSDAFSPWGDAVDGNYFDQDRCLEDFKATVNGHFMCDPTVSVLFHSVPHGSNEIEVIRKGLVAAADQPAPIDNGG